jgi:hypothetical protein
MLLQCSICSGLTEEGDLPDADTSNLEEAGMPPEVIDAMFGDHSQCPHRLNNLATENFTAVDDEDLQDGLF